MTYATMIFVVLPCAPGGNGPSINLLCFIDQFSPISYCNRLLFNHIFIYLIDYVRSVYIFTTAIFVVSLGRSQLASSFYHLQFGIQQDRCLLLTTNVFSC